MDWAICQKKGGMTLSPSPKFLGPLTAPQEMPRRIWSKRFTSDIYTFWDRTSPCPGKAFNKSRSRGREEGWAERKPDSRHFLRADGSQCVGEANLGTYLLLLGSPWAQTGMCGSSLSDTSPRGQAGLIWEKAMGRDGSKSRHLANSPDSAETLANEVTGNGGDTTANAAGPGVPTAELLLSALAPKVPRPLQIRRSWGKGV